MCVHDITNNLLAEIPYLKINHKIGHSFQDEGSQLYC